MNERIFNLLEQANWIKIGLRLTKYATSKTKHLGWRTKNYDSLAQGKTPEDLAYKAIEKVFSGDRQWNPDKNPDLLDYLESVVDSLVSHLVESQNNKRLQYFPENNDGMVLVREAPLEGAEGRLVRGDKCGIIAVKADIREPGKKRFVVAHELGHFELHKNSDQSLVYVDKDLLYSYKNDPKEQEANEFAAELLMPQKLFESRCQSDQPNLDVIRELADEFQTSLTATALRYIEFCPERCAIVISENGHLKWYKATEDFGYHLAVGDKLHPNSVADDFFNGRKMLTTVETVPADTWLLGNGFDSNSFIQEHSVSLPSYNTVLTLIWIDQDIDDFFSDEEDSEYDSDYFTPDGKRWRW